MYKLFESDHSHPPSLWYGKYTQPQNLISHFVKLHRHAKIGPFPTENFCFVAKLIQKRYTIYLLSLSLLFLL